MDSVLSLIWYQAILRSTSLTTTQWRGRTVHRTLLDRILPSLLQASLPVRFWEDAARHALISINLSPTQANECKVSPYSLCTGQTPLYKRLRAFGCKTFRLITGPTRKGKLSKKLNDFIYLYTLSDGDGWMVWDFSLKRPVKTHDAVFHEDVFPGLGTRSKRLESH